MLGEGGSELGFQGTELLNGRAQDLLPFPDLDTTARSQWRRDVDCFYSRDF